MIEVVISNENDGFLLSIDGHGGEEKGYDIYCAGVSSCLIGALNALNNAENFDIVVESGHSMVKSLAKPSGHDEIVLETLICQLKTIARSYPDRVVIKEVSKKEGKQ